MKKLIVLLFILISGNLINLTQSYAGIFNDISYVSLNEVDSFSNIVIFVKFNDETDYVAPYDYSFYENLFNGVDVVSLRDYYLEVSYNKLTIDSYIVNDNLQIIYFTDSHDRSYYEPYHSVDNPNGYPEGGEADREHALLKAAIDYVDINNLVDDSIILDSNDDGDIDSITFMISGEDNGWNSLLWPHKWELTSYYNYTNGEYYNDAPTINGVHAYTYTFELLGNSVSYDYIVEAGVLSHETFHLISAPDLYHYYDSLNIDPIGDWGLMGSTSLIPSHMLGYMKEYYGKWIDNVDLITESGTYTLEPLQESGSNLYRIDLGFSKEYLYIEYRDNLGFYESNLPNSGLLVYRVDFDYFDEGNVFGYYDNVNVGEDEVFLFRPGIPDVTEPITFPLDDDDINNVDGDIDDAALSNLNLYDEMGMGTDILMFYSNGDLIDITISNVVEHDGYITFDITFPPSIQLDIDEELPLGTELYLVDDPIFEYNFSVINIPLNQDVYYTLDGSTPGTNDLLYEGGLISFGASENIITISVYEGNTLISTSSKEFNFVSNIGTPHYPYGNLKNVSWYLDFKSGVVDYSLSFHDDSELELDYDYVYLIDDGISSAYTGIDMRFTEIDYNNENLIINFVSDTYLDDYFGIEIFIEINYLIDITLNGSEVDELNVGDEYVELGASFTGTNVETFSLEIVGSIDTSVLGTQVVTYNVVNGEGVVLETIFRTVTIVDNIAPVVTLVGNENITVEYQDAYNELGVDYLDNLDEDLDYVVTGTVNTNVLGDYILEYSVTDLSGNVSSVITRTVTVVDTEKPLIELVANIDTIYLGDEYIDTGVITSDNHSLDLEVVINGVVDVNVAGEYIIEYTVTDDSGNSSTIKRYVNVLEREVVVEFVCEAGISTFNINSEIIPPNCYVNDVLTDITLLIPVSYGVAPNPVGTFQIIYSITIDGIEYEKVSYVFLIQSSDLMIDVYDFKGRYTV